MVNRRRTKKYDRRKSSRSSLRRSLRKSLNRKNSKRKSRKIVRKNKKRTRKIKQSGGSQRALAPATERTEMRKPFDELISKINANYLGYSLIIGFDTSHFESLRSPVKTGKSIGKLLIMFSMGFRRSPVYTTIYTGDVHWDKDDPNFIHVYFLNPDDETLVFYRVFGLSDFLVVTEVDYTKEDYDQRTPTDSVYVLSMGLHSGKNDFKILVTEASRQNFDEFRSHVNQKTVREIELKLEYIKLKRGLGQGKKYNVGDFKFNSDGLSFQLHDRQPPTVSIPLDDISDFEWEDNAVTVKLHSAKLIRDTQTDNIKFKFKDDDKREARLFVVEKGKQMKLVNKINEINKIRVKLRVRKIQRSLEAFESIIEVNAVKVFSDSGVKSLIAQGGLTIEDQLRKLLDIKKWPQLLNPISSVDGGEPRLLVSFSENVGRVPEDYYYECSSTNQTWQPSTRAVFT